MAGGLGGQADGAGHGCREVEVARYGPGDVFGEMSFLTAASASATVTALTDCTVLGIPHSVLDEAAHAVPAVWTELGGLIAERLALINQRLRERASGSQLWLNWGPGLPSKARAGARQIVRFPPSTAGDAPLRASYRRRCQDPCRQR